VYYPVLKFTKACIGNIKGMHFYHQLHLKLIKATLILVVGLRIFTSFLQPFFRLIDSQVIDMHKC
jgi:hypothetical protein